MEYQNQETNSTSNNSDILNNLQDLQTNTSQDSQEQQKVDETMSKVTDQSGEGMSESSPEKTILTILKAEAEDWKQKALRLGADIQNSQKQNELELIQAKKSAKKQLAKQMLDFVNTLFLSFSFFPESSDQKTKNLVGTLKTSYQKLVDDLKTAQVELIEPKIGDIYDPLTMTALTKSGENADTDSEIKVNQVASLGLKVEGQVVQPAVVVV